MWGVAGPHPPRIAVFLDDQNEEGAALDDPRTEKEAPPSPLAGAAGEELPKTEDPVPGGGHHVQRTTRGRGGSANQGGGRLNHVATGEVYAALRFIRVDLVVHPTRRENEPRMATERRA
jgi:hypothetical protein